jgi:hypothetical protein
VNELGIKRNLVIKKLTGVGKAYIDGVGVFWPNIISWLTAELHKKCNQNCFFE